jgi:hypothetical protein
MAFPQRGTKRLESAIYSHVLGSPMKRRAQMVTVNQLHLFREHLLKPFLVRNSPHREHLSIFPWRMMQRRRVHEDQSRPVSRPRCPFGVTFMIVVVLVEPSSTRLGRCLCDVTRSTATNAAVTVRLESLCIVTCWGSPCTGQHTWSYHTSGTLLGASAQPVLVAPRCDLAFFVEEDATPGGCRRGRVVSESTPLALWCHIDDR